MDEGRLRSILRRIIDLAPPFDGRPELLDQAGTVQAGGSTTHLDLTVDQVLPASPYRGRRVPGACWVRDLEGTPLGTVIVWLNDGYLTSLELGWVCDDPPVQLPEPSLLTAE